MFKIITLGIVSTFLTVAGCQSKGARSTAAVHSPDPAVVCDQCKTTWVRTQGTSPKGHPVPFQYTWKKTEVCDECDKAAKGYYSTGAPPACKMCGGSLQVVEAKK